MAIDPAEARTQRQIDSAKAIVSELTILSGVNVDGSWVADSERTDGHTHEEILDYLALGGRNLYPNDTDAEKAGAIISDKIMDSLKIVGQEKINKRTGDQIKTDAETLAKKGLQSGLISALRYLAKSMYSRLKSGQTSDGGSADKVTEGYARQRKEKWSVNESVVYIASRQLGNALANGKARAKVTGSNIGKLLKNIGR